jgi:hypothetical protein
MTFVFNVTEYQEANEVKQFPARTGSMPERPLNKW